MFERPSSGERAILVQLALPDIDAQTALDEFIALAQSAQAEVVATVIGRQYKPTANQFINQGKVEEIQAQITEHEADIVLINHELSPSQERNLEKVLKCRVIDRSGLILDIFAQRARTFEGKLQVELAQLAHLSTRLVRGWTHLERQKGGIGLRGPGEKQLETDRRLLRARIKAIHARLKKVRQSRDQNRRARKKVVMPTVSLVGYTNAGKSSLFNTLTGEVIYAADQLFATLDPTMRKLDLPGANPVILADTVGFIQNLPHELIEAFQATLEESREADLLLHVIDISNPNWRDEVEAVNTVLTEIGADEIPRVLVFNKIDQSPNYEAKLNYDESGCNVWLSAKTREGLELLKEAIIKSLYGGVVEETITLEPHQASLRAKLHNIDAIIDEQLTEEGRWKLTLRMSKAKRKELL